MRKFQLFAHCQEDRNEAKTGTILSQIYYRRHLLIASSLADTMLNALLHRSSQLILTSFLPPRTPDTQHTLQTRTQRTERLRSFSKATQSVCVAELGLLNPCLSYLLYAWILFCSSVTAKPFPKSCFISHKKRVIMDIIHFLTASKTSGRDLT